MIKLHPVHAVRAWLQVLAAIVGGACLLYVEMDLLCQWGGAFCNW